MLGASLTYRVGSLPAQKRRTGARHVARVPLLAWRRPLPAHGLRSTPWITPHPRGQSCIAVSQGGAAWGDDVSSTDAAPPLPGQRRAARTSAAGGASRDRMAAAAAITSSYGGGGAASSPSSGGGSRIGGLSALVGASAQQLLSSAMHSLDVFEHRELQTLDSDTDTLGDESLEELNGSGAAQPAHIVKANYEVLRLDEAGAVRRLRIRRRDLLREHQLQPRDLRRIDPSLDIAKASPSITIKEDALLLSLGGVRAIVSADKALLFEPGSSNTRKLLDTLVPRLQASAGQRLAAKQAAKQAAAAAAAAELDDPVGYRDSSSGSAASGMARQADAKAPPFELEVLEGVLMVATGRLDAEVLLVTRRVGELLTKLPRDINPVNLEELRRIKQTLVELEDKADTLREMLEQIMDDEDELRELNLSSRPRREERRKQRERDRMERQLTRAREEMEQQSRRSISSLDGDERHGGSSGGGSTNGGGQWHGVSGALPSDAVTPAPGSAAPSWQVLPGLPREGISSSSSSDGSALPTPLALQQLQQQQQQQRQAGRDAGAARRRERLAELYAKHGVRRGPNGVMMRQPSGRMSPDDATVEQQQRRRDTEPRDLRDARERDRDRDREREREGGLDPEDELQEAQDALEEMAEAEEEEQELEEVEDLLEYYLQRASATQSEAERLLEGARDLEESIGVSLSARRYEVNRLELMLSMGSFAAALGAMIAGIFGMNMRSTLELSVTGFWGVTGSIVVGCVFVFAAIMRYTQRKRIL